MANEDASPVGGVSRIRSWIDRQSIKVMAFAAVALDDPEARECAEDLIPDEVDAEVVVYDAE